MRTRKNKQQPNKEEKMQEAQSSQIKHTVIRSYHRTIYSFCLTIEDTDDALAIDVYRPRNRASHRVPCSVRYTINSMGAKAKCL